MIESTTLVLRHFQAKVLHLLRQPSYVVTTLLFPSLFFLFFAAPNAETPEKANLLMASFAAFAVLGVAFFQFGLDFSQERATAWYRYMRTLPASPWTFFAARCLTAIFFSILSAGVVMAVVTIFTPANLGALALLKLTGVLMVGSLPFCVLGLCIGYFVKPATALPVTNLIYLLLSFAGGLWIPPAGLHPKIQEVSTWLPSRFYGEWAWGAALGTGTQAGAILGLAITFLLALPIAVWGHRRSV